MPRSDQSPAADHVPTALDPIAFRRLLVAVDGSRAAGAAASFAIRLAGTTAVDVTLLHACPDLRLAEHAGPMAEPAAFQAAAEHRLAETAVWQRRLQNLTDDAVPGAHVRSCVVRGRAAPAVLDAATEYDSDVVLVGSRGLGSVRGRLLGSVSAQVVDHASCSVMVFPARQARAPARVTSVIVGADGSPSSAAAVTAGSTLAAALDAKLVLLTAFERVTSLAPVAAASRVRDRREASTVLAAARASVTVDVEVVEALRDGSPREALLVASERFGPAVLAVGTGGLGGFESLLVGSTSRWLLHHAACPVLVGRHRP